MGQHVFATYQDFNDAQDSMSLDVIEAAHFNFSTLTLSVPDHFDAEVIGAIAGANDSIFNFQLLTRIEALEGSSGNPTALVSWIGNQPAP